MLKIDPAVFDLIDPRVQALQTGKITVNSFAFTIQPYDCMCIINNTVYALSQTQYYALLPIEPAKQFTKDQFQSLLKRDLKLSQEDRKKVDYIRSAKDGCPVCKYNSFKTQLRGILLKYPEYKQLIGEDADSHIHKSAPYPKVKKQIPQKLMQLHPHLFEPIVYDRTPCFDCVQKHIGMAYVKGTEVQTGYPQHFMLCLANLQQAYQQCPVECTELRQTILFCISKSKQENKPFVPVNILCGLVDIFRRNSKSEIALTENAPAPDMQLQLSDTMSEAIHSIPITQKVPIAAAINQILKLISKQNIDSSKQLRVQWAGRMVSLADMFLPFSVDLSNMLRNRRLIFKAAPSLSKGTEYSGQDILAQLKKN